MDAHQADTNLSTILAALKVRAEPQLFLLTGPSGCGKTTFCLELTRQARLAGFQPVGLVSPAVFEQEIKTGIDLVDIASGERRRLAVKRNRSIPRSPHSPHMTRLSWQMDSQTLEWGNQILERLPTTRELLILDELGPLEFWDNHGLIAGMRYIDARVYQVACIVVRPSLLPTAMERWPWARVISLENRPAEGNPG